MAIGKNHEGYPDPTAGTALGNIKREDRQKEAEMMYRLNKLLQIINEVSEISGFEVVGRITFKDKATGKELK